MPVYSFICPVCGEQFDEKISFKDDPHSAVCPRGHTGARRVFAAPTIVFKGSGFYVTDHRKPAAKEHSGD